MEADNIIPDEKTYCSIVHAWTKVRDVARAEFWVKRMQQHQHKLNKVTFSSLIHACSMSGHQSRAEYWLTSMVKAGIEPTLLCYNMVIQVCAVNGNYDAAIDWFGKLLSLNLSPDRCTYASLIEVSARTGDAGAVDLLLREMISKDFHPNELTRLALARGSALAGDTKGRTDVWANYMIMRAYASTGKAEGVQQWHEKLISDGINLPKSFYKELAYLCVENQNVNKTEIQPTLLMPQQIPPAGMQESANSLCKPDDLTMVISTLESIISKRSC